MQMLNQRRRWPSLPQGVFTARLLKCCGKVITRQPWYNQVILGQRSHQLNLVVINMLAKLHKARRHDRALAGCQRAHNRAGAGMADHNIRFT